MAELQMPQVVSPPQFRVSTASPMTPRPSVSQPWEGFFIACKLTNKGLKLVTSMFIP